jgi:hypothetical protein
LEDRKRHTQFPYTTFEEFEDGSPDDAKMWLAIAALEARCPVEDFMYAYFCDQQKDRDDAR